MTMKHKTFKFLVPIALFFSPMFASAAPGYFQTGIRVMPLDAPKVIAAMDKMMASPTGQKYKGRLLLLQNVADGNNPATHSFVSIFKSAADLETYTNLMQDDPARTEFMKAVASISHVESTARLSTLKSWGDINDTDTVWNAHYFNVTDPAKFVAAIDAWNNSPAGKKTARQVHLAAMAAGGMTDATHVISVGYSSNAEMEMSNDANRNDPDWQKLLDAIRPVSTHLGADLSRTLKQWGTASMKSLTNP
jgi:hypothetical protein